jgi:hypothetical protein
MMDNVINNLHNFDRDKLDSLIRNKLDGLIRTEVTDGCSNTNSENDIIVDIKAVMLGSGQSIKVELIFDTIKLEKYLLQEVIVGGTSISEITLTNVLGTDALLSATKVLAHELRF